MNEIPEVPHQQMQWIAPPVTYAMPPPPVQHSADPYLQPAYDQMTPMMTMQHGGPVPMHGGQEYIPPLHQISPQQVHNVAAALTQMTHATPHSVPIMATHSAHDYGAPSPRYQSYYNQGRYYNGGKNGHPRFQRDREVTKIPSRFQKQSTKAPNTYSQRKAIKERNLPKALGTTAPASARRLTVFGTGNAVNNLSEPELGEELGVPVRLVPVDTLNAFQEKISVGGSGVGPFRIDPRAVQRRP